jgi:hypothetical protein
VRDALKLAPSLGIAVPPGAKPFELPPRGVKNKAPKGAAGKAAPSGMPKVLQPKASADTIGTQHFGDAWANRAKLDAADRKEMEDIVNELVGAKK